MKSFLTILGLLVASAAGAQTATTLCTNYVPNQLNCQTTVRPGASAPQQPLTGLYQQLGSAPQQMTESLQRNKEANLQAQQMREQTEQLRQQTEILRQQSEATQRQQQAAQDRAQVQAREVPRQPAAADDLDRYFQKLEACLRLEKATGEDATVCRDKLIVSDPEFAATYADMNRKDSPFVKAMVEAAKDIQERKNAAGSSK